MSLTDRGVSRGNLKEGESNISAAKVPLAHRGKVAFEVRAVGYQWDTNNWHSAAIHLGCFEF